MKWYTSIKNIEQDIPNTKPFDCRSCIASENLTTKLESASSCFFACSSQPWLNHDCINLGKRESKTNKTKLQSKDWGIPWHVTIMLSQSNVVKHSWNCHNEPRMIYGFNLGKKQKNSSGAGCFVRSVVHLSATEKENTVKLWNTAKASELSQTYIFPQANVRFWPAGSDWWMLS